MTRRLTIGTAVALAASALVAVILSASGSAQTSGARTIKLFEREKGSTFRFVDNPPKSRNKRRPRASTGDVFVFSTPIFNEARKLRLGQLSVQCTVSRPGTERTETAVCHGAFALKDGQIAVEAVVRGDPKTVVAAVTGGTGVYEGARGTLRSKTVKKGSEDTITLLP